MTMRYIGGGHKKKYRVIDFIRNKDGIPAHVDSIQYDPNPDRPYRTVVYADGEKRYMLAPNGLQLGQTVLSGDDIAPEIGNALPLAKKSSWYYSSQHRITSGTGRYYGPFGRYLCTANLT